jgi:hypothetical protein
MKQVTTLIGLLVMACAVGCGSAVDEAETAEDTGSTVSASAASLELGVDHWRVRGDGTALGFDANNQRIAEFRVDGTARVVTSLFPDRGVLALDRSHGRLSPRALALYDALAADVKAGVERIEQPALASDVEGETVDKAIYSCYSLWHDCDLQGFYGVLNGWWTGYICEISNNTRPYCGNWWALLY